MGLDKQPNKIKLSPSGYKKNQKSWSQKWEDRASRAGPGSEHLMGPPPGIPVGRSGGGTKPVGLGDLDEGKLFPHQWWTKQHEAKYRLGRIDAKGKPLRPKHGAAPSRPLGGPRDLSLILGTTVGRELLTEEAEKERAQREHDLNLQNLKALENEPRVEQDMDRLIRLRHLKHLRDTTS